MGWMTMIEYRWMLPCLFLVAMMTACKRERSTAMAVQDQQSVAAEQVSSSGSALAQPTATPSMEELERLRTLKTPVRCTARVGTDSVTWEEEAWAREVVHDRTGLVLVFVSPGRFLMGGAYSPEQTALLWGGTAEQYWSEHPQHEVVIHDPFYMGATEVTLRAFRRFVADTGYVTDAEKRGYAVGLRNESSGHHPGMSWRQPGYEQTDQYPVSCVSWNDARAFCQWSGCRLPSEAEWEYACRAESSTCFSFGADVFLLEEHAWFFANSSNRSHRVASKLPNAWGIYDMHGNLLEWCNDLWHATYHQAPRDATAWEVGGVIGMRVLRGGGWGSAPSVCRSSFRIRGPEDVAVSGNGFRVVRDLS